PMPDQIPNPNTRAFAIDKQGRLLVATTGGVFRLESAANPGPPMPDGGVGGGLPDGGATPAPRPLSLVLENAPWATSSFNPGFAVDAAERVYRADQTTIYSVANGVASPYLTLSDAVTGAGL